MKKSIILSIFIINFIVLFCLYDISFGDILKYTDNDGVIHLTNNYDICQKYRCVLVMKENRIFQSMMSSLDWVEYDRSKDGSVRLYNKRNITKSVGKNIVQVWTKWIFSEKEREKIIELIRNSGMSTEGMGKPFYYIILNQIDCKNKKILVLSFTDYDINDKVLQSSGVIEEPKWEYIVPDSVGDILRKKVCK